jgi:hypothetical protein
MATTSSFAEIILGQLGIDLRPIQTANENRADFLATIADTVTLIEEKTKMDDPGAEAARKEALGAGRMHSSHIPIKPDNRLSGINRKASKQLASTAPTFTHNFRLVWCTATGSDCRGKQEQFIATVYGTTRIVELGNSTYQECYFFRNSDFFRFSENLDGAVAAYADGKEFSATLCLNPLSPRYVGFKASPFVKAFGSAVHDPVENERDKLAFIVDRDIDRKHEDRFLAFLQQKYSTRPLMNMDMGYSFISKQVPFKERG